MQNYVIHTDSGCDICPELLQQWGVSCTDLTLTFEGEDKEYTCPEINGAEFYDKMRNGGVAKTAAANIDTFEKAFEPYLQQGQDILYLGFSSGLSATYNSAHIAAQQLLEKYPERKIITVDTLAASAGQGLLLYLAVKKKNDNATIVETAEYIENLVPNLSHWFTVDDLEYLKRGGRVSPTVAFVGSLLGIKPVLHVDNEGHLIKVSTARGRKKAIEALADMYSALTPTPADGVVFISHADCIQDAQTLAQMLNGRFGVTVELITDIGPIIGAHAGPGTLALFFVAKER